MIAMTRNVRVQLSMTGGRVELRVEEAKERTKRRPEIESFPRASIAIGRTGNRSGWTPLSPGGSDRLSKASERKKPPPSI